MENNKLKDQSCSLDGIMAVGLFSIKTENLKKAKEILNRQYYLEKDVKQFIKDLKGKFPKNSNHHSSWIIKYIDELAGDME